MCVPPAPPVANSWKLGALAKPVALQRTGKASALEVEWPQATRLSRRADYRKGLCVLQQRFDFAEDGFGMRNAVFQRQIGGAAVDHAQSPTVLAGQFLNE